MPVGIVNAPFWADKEMEFETILLLASSVIPQVPVLAIVTVPAVSVPFMPLVVVPLPTWNVVAELLFIVTLPEGDHEPVIKRLSPEPDASVALVTTKDAGVMERFCPAVTLAVPVVIAKLPAPTTKSLVAEVVVTVTVPFGAFRVKPPAIDKDELCNVMVD